MSDKNDQAPHESEQSASARGAGEPPTEDSATGEASSAERIKREMAAKTAEAVTKAKGLWAGQSHAHQMAFFAAAVLVVFALGFFIRPLVWGPKQSDTSTVSEGTTAERKIKHWTCSMHPQVNRKKEGFCPICKMELIPVYEEEGATVGDQKMTPRRQIRLTPTAVALAEIESAPVERKVVVGEVSMVGKVTYDETRLAYITAWVPGRLDRLFVDYTGIPVREGDHMVYLYSPELYQAQEELLEAEAAVENYKKSGGSEAALKRAQRTLEASKEKLRLWGLTDKQVADIRARGTPSDHMTIYSPKGGIVIHKEGLQGMYVQPGTRIYTIADLSQLWVMLEAYESDLQWLRYGQRVEFTTEAYPGETFEGRISFIEPFLTDSRRTVGVRVNVSNADGRLKPNMFIRARVRAQLASGGKVMDSDLVGKWICPMHPAVVRDKVGNCDVCEMPLETVESLGYAAPGRTEPPLVIPASAPLLTGKRAVVYVEVPSEKGPTFEGREIVLGPRAGKWYLVRAGLSEGEKVVTKGNFKIDSELYIRAKPSMMNPAGGKGGGGHQHDQGGAKPMGQEGEPAGTKTAVPTAFRSSLRLALVSMEAVRVATHRGKLEAIRSAYTMLGDAVGVAEPDFLQGHARMLWDDVSRALRLDVAEGTDVRTLGEARSVLKRLEEDHKKLLGAFGPLEGSARGHEGHGGAEVAKIPKLPEDFRRGFVTLFAAYAALGARLAGDDAAGAKSQVGVVEKTLRAVSAEGLPAEVRKTWNSQSETLSKTLQALKGTDAIGALRSGFLPLSKAMAETLRALAAEEGRPVHLFRCPMAFDGKGGVWLSEDRQVRNVYFGSEMLECGSIIETLTLPLSGDGKEHKAHGADQPGGGKVEEAKIPEAFQSTLAQFFKVYGVLGERLASDDASGAKKQASTAAKALSEVSAATLSGELQAHWKARSAEFSSVLKTLQAASDIEALRRGFLSFSEAMARALRDFADSDGTPVYLFRCPMAFDGRGGVWLSESRTVRNPYFGAAMLECGSIIETLSLTAHVEKESQDHE